MEQQQQQQEYNNINAIFIQGNIVDSNFTGEIITHNTLQKLSNLTDDQRVSILENNNYFSTEPLKKILLEHYCNVNKISSQSIRTIECIEIFEYNELLINSS